MSMIALETKLPLFRLQPSKKVCVCVCLEDLHHSDISRLSLLANTKEHLQKYFDLSFT